VQARPTEPDLFERIHGWISRLESASLVVLLLGLIGLGLSQILLRNLAGISLAWADGAMRAMVLWLAMIAAAVAAGQLRHIRINILESWVAPPVMRWINRLTLFLTGLVCLAMTWLGLNMLALEYQFQTTAFLAVPTWVVHLVVPFGFAMMAARFLAHAVSPVIELEQAPFELAEQERGAGEPRP
jgi:C4-dicarboxylate transporter, DctQ subunit